MKKLLFLAFFIFSLHAEQVEISADNFIAEDAKKRAEFSGNVKIKKGADFINASRVVVSFDSNSKPNIYTATGNISFEITLDKNRRFKGVSQKIIYDAKNSEYTLEGNVDVVEIGKNRSLKGEKAILNTKTKESRVFGKENAPVIFKFDIDEK